MIIKRIELNNFRIYKGLNVIDLTPQKNKNIYIVSGKNGFGKTTFLMSLVWCLYGRQMQDVDELYRREIEDQGSYPKYISNSLNRSARASDNHSFSVKIVIADAIIPELTCSEISIQRTYDTLTGTEDLKILIDGFQNELIQELRSDRMKGEDAFIRDYLLPIEIAKFFFFDAEKIVNLAEVNTPEQRRKLSKAYSEILGIKKYEDAKAEIDETRIRLRKRSASTKEQEQLNSLEAEIENAKLAIENKQLDINSVREERVGYRFTSDELQKKLIRVGNLISVDELEELRSKGAELDNRLKEIQDSLAKSYEIVPFAIAASTLTEVVEQVKLEREYKDAKYKQENTTDVTESILNDLIEEQKVCDHRITAPVQQFYFDTIRKLITKYFPSEVPAFPAEFKLLHDLTESEIAGLEALLTNLRHEFRLQFQLLTNSYNTVKGELSVTRRRISEAEASAEDEVVKADRDRKNSLDHQIESIDRQIGGLEMGITQLQNEIAAKEKVRAELSHRLSVSQGDREKDQIAEGVSKSLREYITLYKHRKKESLQDEILAGLKMLMHKKGFVDKVKVDIIEEDIDIDLLDKQGKPIPKESLSKGEQQLYATALLYGLVEESDIKFPVFIDSPMQKFDDSHAGNIVKHFYPKIADQVILFPLINKELSEAEYKMLLPNVAKAYLIVNHDSEYSDFREVKPEKLFAEHNALNLD